MSQQFWKTLPLALRLPAAARQRPRRVDDQRTRPVGAIVIVRRRRGSAADFHALQIPAALDEAEAWVFEVERPALVLGSSQRGQVTVADPAVEVVRRNSGGGAVLLVPGRCLWIDVLLARDDPRWSDDVGKSSYWLGEVWASALPGSEVYRGRLQQTTWGRLVCFGALGPGEVTIAGRKVVGISQRRTRLGALFQCLVHPDWEPAGLLARLDLPEADRRRALADLHDIAAGPGIPLGDLETAVLAALVA